jgi:hypothetical protein
VLVVALYQVLVVALYQVLVVALYQVLLLHQIVDYRTYQYHLRQVLQAVLQVHLG